MATDVQFTATGPSSFGFFTGTGVVKVGVQALGTIQGVAGLSNVGIGVIGSAKRIPENPHGLVPGVGVVGLCNNIDASTIPVDFFDVGVLGVGGLDAIPPVTVLSAIHSGVVGLGRFAGVRGDSRDGDGVVGTSQNKAGVRAFSEKGIALVAGVQVARAC